MFQISASMYGSDTSRPMNVEINAVFDNPADAEKIAALFPKSRLVKVSPVSGDRKVGPNRTDVTMKADLTGHDSNPVNETGAKRFNMMLRDLDKHGIAYEYTTPYSNSYESLDALRAVIG